MSPILDLNTIEFFSRSPDQTRRVGIRLGELLRTGDVICLEGDLGSGKTTLVQGVAAGWGSPNQVTSPTFVLINPYYRPEGAPLYHLDAYRLAGSEEAEDLDIDIMLETGPLVVEWAERIKAALPDQHLWIHLRWLDDQQRGMLISAQGKRYERLLESLKQSVYAIGSRK